jgi:hypothetical protein
VPFHGSTRAFNNSKLALPYICRLITLSRLMCPSGLQLLHVSLNGFCQIAH